MMPPCKRSLICDITQIFCTKLFHVCLICSQSWQVNAINWHTPTIVILPTVFRQIFSKNHHDYNVAYPNTMVYNWLITAIIKKRRSLISMPSSITHIHNLQYPAFVAVFSEGYRRFLARCVTSSVKVNQCVAVFQNSF